MAKPVICKQCGGNDPERISEEEYRCRYCDSLIRIDSPKINLNFSQFRKHFIPAREITGPGPGKFIRYFFLIMVLVVAAVGIFISVIVNNNVPESKYASNTITVDSYWSEPGSGNFRVYAGSKGDVTWEILQQSTTKLDSARNFIRIADAKTGKVTKELRLFKTRTWKENFEFNKEWGHMLQVGDRVFVGSEMNGLHARNIYSGAVVLSNDALSKKFPELKEGIVSAEFSYSKLAFKLTTNDGYIFYYFPKADKIATEEEFNNSYRNIKVERSFFTLKGEERPELLYISKPVDTTQTDYSRIESELSQAKDEYYKKYYGFKLIQPLNEGKAYFNGKILSNHASQCIVMYTPSVSKTTAPIIEAIDKSGKTIWKINLSEVEEFRNIIQDGNYVESSESAQTLALYFISAHKTAIGINKKSGKIEWKYKD